MRLSPLVFERELVRFKKGVEDESGGERFKSFRDGLPAEQESYKEHIRYEALRRLNIRSWSRTAIGRGAILNRLIDAIEINESAIRLRNNLVNWPNKFGHKNRSHHRLLDAAVVRQDRARFEHWLFDFFRGNASDREAFDSFRQLAGDRYDLVAYLFFLKDWTRFMPIAPTTFDRAFRLLELDVKTAHQCSWENYRQFNDALRAVQRRLRDVGSVPSARLIDAHSFCWMLIRLQRAPSQRIAIELPEPITNVSPPAPRHRDAEDVDDRELEESDDEWFSRRDAQRRRIGKLAQEIALQAERLRLRALNHGNPEAAALPVWNETLRGYDILSEEHDGGARYIEVKAARRAADELSFFVTANEWRCAQTQPNYWFYLVLNVESARPKVRMLPASKCSSSWLQPTNYLAAIRANP